MDQESRVVDKKLKDGQMKGYQHINPDMACLHIQCSLQAAEIHAMFITFIHHFGSS